MKKNRFTLIPVVMVAAMFAGAHAEEPKPDANAPLSTFPGTFLKTSPDLARFAEPAYFKTLAADGLRSSDPKALFQRIVAATQAGQAYKALYLSRLFTELQPDNRVGWTNRAKVAASLGFDAEAAAAQANAETGTTRPLSGAALPGIVKARPSTLADWAAALALISDDTTAREGRPVVIAVRDDLSGVSVASAQEIERQGRGPWANAKPVQIEDVLTNLFAMPQATPMDGKSVKGGMFALGALALAGSAYTSSVGAADSAATLAGLYGAAMASAYEVPSDFKGGEFISTTYANGAPRATKMSPKTAGKREAIGTPLPLLWASGPSLSPFLAATWRNGDTNKSEAIGWTPTRRSRSGRNTTCRRLVYPRLHQLCAGADVCSPKLTVLELILSAEDLRALAPGTDSRLPNVEPWAAKYTSREAISVVAAGNRFAGFDPSGVTYITRHRPTEWLITSSSTGCCAHAWGPRRWRGAANNAPSGSSPTSSGSRLAMSGSWPGRGAPEAADVDGVDPEAIVARWPGLRSDGAVYHARRSEDAGAISSVGQSVRFDIRKVTGSNPVSPTIRYHQTGPSGPVSVQASSGRGRPFDAGDRQVRGPSASTGRAQGARDGATTGSSRRLRTSPRPDELAIDEEGAGPDSRGPELATTAGVRDQELPIGPLEEEEGVPAREQACGCRGLAGPRGSRFVAGRIAAVADGRSHGVSDRRARRTPRGPAARSPPTGRTRPASPDRRCGGTGARARGGRPGVDVGWRNGPDGRLSRPVPAHQHRPGRRGVPQRVGRDAEPWPASPNFIAGHRGRRAGERRDPRLPRRRIVGQPPEREDREVASGDDVRAVSRPPQLDERRVLPPVRLGSLDTRMDREDRRPRHAVLETRPRRTPERRAPGAAALQRADGPTERRGSVAA